jgi:hypothetical protein
MDAYSDPTSPRPPADPAVGYLSNGGTQRYLMEAESTTGYVAWQTADGTTLISQSMQVSIAASPSIRFWSCAGYQDTTPAGRILSFDCHGNAIAQLDVRGLAGLEYLDCSYNKLVELPLTGLTELEGLDADDNQLASLDVHDLQALRVLNCAGNRLRVLDITGLDGLQILDCSNNQLVTLRYEGCNAIRDFRGDGNPVDFTRHSP